MIMMKSGSIVSVYETVNGIIIVVPASGTHQRLLSKLGIDRIHTRIWRFPEDLLDKLIEFMRLALLCWLTLDMLALFQSNSAIER